MDDLPIGFSFTLATDSRAMSNFSNMTDEEKRQVLEASRTIKTKAEMERFVHQLGMMEENKESFF